MDCRLSPKQTVEIVSLAKEAGYKIVKNEFYNKDEGCVASIYSSNELKLWPNSNEADNGPMSFEEMVSFFTKLRKGSIMKTFVCEVVCDEVRECLEALAVKAGVKVDAARPWKKGLLGRVHGNTLGYGSFTRTVSIDDAFIALQKPELKLGEMNATVDGEIVTVDYSGTKYTMAKAELKEALKYVKGFEAKSYNVSVATEKKGDVYVGVGLQVGCQLLTVAQIEAVLA